MKNNRTHHADATIKGVALGALTYAGTQFNLSAEVIALAVPIVALGLSWLSTKIGDKNTTLLLKVAIDALAKAPAKKKK
jgi:hypothetical protein